MVHPCQKSPLGVRGLIMKLPRLPLLDGIQELLYGLFFQGEAIQVHREYMDDNKGFVMLNVPPEAQYCIIVLEADPTSSDKTNVVRWNEIGLMTNQDFGMPLGHLGVLEIRGRENMTRFIAQRREGGKTHLMWVQYYS